MAAYALTRITSQRRAFLTRTENAETLVTVLFHYRDQGRYRLHGFACMASRAWLPVHGFAVMPEHLLLLTPTPGQTIERCAQCFRGDCLTQSESNSAVKSGNPAWANTGFASGQTSPVKSGTLQRIRGNAGLHDHAYAHTMFSDRLEPMPDEPMPDELNQTQRRASRTPGFVVKPGLRFCLRFWRSG